MPGAIGTPHLGARRHIRISQEATFGTVNPAPSWVYVPILEDGMKLKATSPRYRPDTNFGGDYRRHVHVCHSLQSSGDIICNPWPEVTGYLLDMALARTAAHDLNSYTVDHFTPTDPRRYTGTVIDRLTIAVTGTGDADVRLTLGCVAKLEAENDDLEEASFTYAGVTPVPFMFRDAAILIGAIHRIDLEAFTITVENNLAQGPNVQTAGTEQGTVGYLIAQQRAISLELTELNVGDTINEAIRDCNPLAFEARFSHPDGHMWQIQLPYIYPEESDEDGTPSQVTKESPRFEVGCDDGGCDIIYGVDLAAGGTTTLAELTTTAPA